MNGYENLKFVVKKHIPSNLYSQDVIKDLLELVELHTPKKVTTQSCPSCDTYLSIYFRNTFKFCPYCGQALDWNDSNER